MPSLKFPDTGTRMVLLPTGKRAIGATGYLVANAAGTVTAEVYADVNGVKGALLPLDSLGRRSVPLDGEGEQPDYWGPADGTTRLWIVVNGVVSQVHADYNARIEAAVQRSNHTGVQATSTITGLDTALSVKQRALGTFVATDPQWGYVSGIDIAPACQAAINAMPSSGPYAGGKLVIPPGNWDFSVPVVLKSGVHIQGAGELSSRINARSGGMFTWTSGLTEVVIEHLQLVCYSGHMLTTAGGFGIDTCKFRNLYMRMADINGSIMHFVGTDAGIIRVDWEDCYFYRSTGSLVSAFHLVSNGGAINENVWDKCWAHSNNCTSSPFFYLESTAAQSYAYGNVFKNITGEQNAGGLIDVRSSHNLICERVVDYDATVEYEADIIRVGKSASSLLKSLSTVISSCGRIGGVPLPAGLYDVNLVPGEVGRSTIIAPHHSSSGLRLNFAATDHVTLIDCPPGAWVGQPANVGHYFNRQAQFANGLLVGSTQKIAGTGNPNGTVTGSVGDEYTRTDGSSGTALYVKESGTATNTGWVAHGGSQPPPATGSTGRRLLSGFPSAMDLGTTALAADTWRYMPLTLAAPLTVSYLTTVCSVAPTGGTANLIFALYALDAGGRPAARQADYSSYGLIDLTTGVGGEKTLTTTGLVIPAGSWMIGCAWSGTGSGNATLYATSGYHPGVAGTTTTQQSSAYTQSVSGATAPATASTAGPATTGIAVYAVMA